MEIVGLLIAASGSAGGTVAKKTEVPPPSVAVVSNPNPTELSSYFKKSFLTMVKALPIQVADPITEQSPNSVVWQILDLKKQVLGYAREIRTTTGCNLYCLPLHFILMLDSKLHFKALVEIDPLTKKNHALFTDDDRLKINLILNSPPPSFAKAKEPLDLVDAITRETKLVHEGDVVKEAALTSFRSYQYLMQTQAALKAKAAKAQKP